MEPLILQTLASVDQLFATVKRMPVDKLNWSPLDQGRTVIDQLRECALAPDYFQVHIDPTHTPMATSYEEAAEVGKKWTTVEELEGACRAATEKFVEALRKLDSATLTEKRTMPWGSEMSVAEIAGLHNWNMIYHIGQINYIQTLYGDKEMM